jgi:hypothetical protein
MTSNVLTELKVTCNTIEKYVKKLEDKEQGVGVSTTPTQSEPRTTKTPKLTPKPLFGTNVTNFDDEVVNRSKELPFVDVVVDVDMLNDDGSWSQTTMMGDEPLTPFLPSVWLPESVNVGATAGEPTEKLTIPRSDFRRTHAEMV